jgi:hypothetical protein
VPSPVRRRLARWGAPLFLAWLAVSAGCGAPEKPAPVEAAGTYVVLDDSSRVHFLYLRDAAARFGTFSRVLGTVSFQERSRNLLLGSGALTLDLAEVSLPDTAQAAALARDFFQVGSKREFRTARLAVRELFGKRFTSRLPLGGVTPVTARAQLVVHDMAISRDFVGEITRTPTGYRITTSIPLIFSIRQLGMADELAAWTAATGGGAVEDVVAVTVDLRLARRDDAEAPGAAAERPSREEGRGGPSRRPES